VSSANCPACGGPIEFAIGSSIVVVCNYCHSVIARTDRDLESLGKVAALIDTGSVLRRDLPGKYGRVGFRLTGRTQLRNQTGATWDEWYAAFDDGRWGWLAEAQSRYFITFTVAGAKPPAMEEIAVGERLVVPADMVVNEIGRAELVGAEGEIPWRAVPGSVYTYADLSGRERRFATIDYSEETPLLFEGYETTLAELGISAALEPQRAGARVSVAKLSCSRCGGALELVAPDKAERIVCPNCGAMHDVAEGNLKYLRTLEKKKIPPRLPLGSRGTLEGVAYTVTGYMQRSVTFDRTYYWREYLLYNATSGFRWLVDDDDHWSFVTPINAAEVEEGDSRERARRVAYQGRTYKIFQDAVASVAYVLGEFYWKVEVGEQVRGIDYIAPPYGLSKEITTSEAGQEVNYSHARYVQPEEIEKAFGVKVPRPRSMGALQPVRGEGIGSLWRWFALALVVVAILLAVSRPRRVVLSETYDLGAPLDNNSQWGQTTGSERSRVIFTRPFTLEGGHNLMIQGFAGVENKWLYAAGDLVNESTGSVDSFELPIEFYEGVEDNEHWTEGDRTKRVYLSALPKGQYTMRIEAQWPGDSRPEPLHLEVREGVFRWPHFFLALAVISLGPLVSFFRRLTFAQRRWADSQFTSSGGNA